MAQQPKTEVIGERKTNWWLIIAGIVLMIFAIGTFAFPVFFLELITITAGIGFLFAGVSGIATFFQVRSLPGAGWTLLMAVLDILVGALMLMHPVVFAPVLPWILGASFVLFGIVETAGTAPLGKLIPESRPITIVSGVLTILVGIMFIVWPTSLSIWVAAFAAVRGITLIAMGIMSRA